MVSERGKEKAPDPNPVAQLKRWWYIRRKSKGMLQSIEEEMEIGLGKMVSERRAMLINN
jgi:hypothetical protein